MTTTEPVERIGDTSFEDDRNGGLYAWRHHTLIGFASPWNLKDPEARGADWYARRLGCAARRFGSQREALNYLAEEA